MIDCTDEQLMEEVLRRGFVIRDATVGKKWVDLTTEEVKSIVNLSTFDDAGYDIFTDGFQVALMVGVRLKEKNGG